MSGQQANPNVPSNSVDLP